MERKKERKRWRERWRREIKREKDGKKEKAFIETGGRTKQTRQNECQAARISRGPVTLVHAAESSDDDTVAKMTASASGDANMEYETTDKSGACRQ